MPDPLLTCLCGCPAPRDHSVASGHGRAGPLAGPPAAARGNSRARDGPCWVVPSGRGRGREDEGCPGGGGERCSHGRARTPTGTVIFSRSLDRRLPGLPEPRPGKEASPRAGAGLQPGRAALGGNFHMANPHTRRTDVSSHGEPMPFCFLSGDPSQGLGAGAPPRNAPPEPPAAGHGARRGDPLARTSLAKSPQGQARGRRPRLEPKPTPRTGRFPVPGTRHRVAPGPRDQERRVRAPRG